MEMTTSWLGVIVALAAAAIVAGIAWAVWIGRKRTAGAITAANRGPAAIESRFVSCGDEQIHFVQTGNGPHLVLLHGIGASLFIWRFVIQDLCRHYTVTALDLPGFGKSSKHPQADYGLDAQHDRVLRFLDTLGIERALLCGSSMGGALALWLARKDPERFPAVAALAPATNPAIIPRRLARMAAMLPHTHRILTRSTMRLLLTRVVARSELIHAESIEAYLEPYLDEGVSVRTFLAAMELLGDPRLPGCFEGLRSRVLLVHGERDALVSRASLLRLRLHLGDVTAMASHPTAGHHIMEDEPEWTGQRLLDFFTRQNL